MKSLYLYIEKNVNYFSLGNLKFQGIINATLFSVNFTMLKIYPQIFRKKLKILKKNLVKQIFHKDSSIVVVQFSNSTYNNNERNEEDEMIISPQLFELAKKMLLLQVPFCEANEKKIQNPFK